MTSKQDKCLKTLITQAKAIVFLSRQAHLPNKIVTLVAN